MHLVRVRRAQLATIVVTVLCALFLPGVGAAAPAAQGPHREVGGTIAYDRPDPASPDDTFVSTIRPDGSRERQVLPSHTCCPGWSPDGRRLALPRGTVDGRIGTATVRPDGSDYTPLPIHDPTLNIGCGTGSWSPDGRRLACESWDDADTTRNGIYVMSSRDGGGLRRVTHNPLGGHDIPGAYSPTGDRIVFVRFDQDGGSAGIFTVRADGTGLRPVVPADVAVNIGVDWSPRGGRILFSRRVTPDVRGSLWLVRPDGTHLRPLRVSGMPCGGPLSAPDSIGCHGPRWSPDGHDITFIANSATTADVYVATAHGHCLHQVTHDGDADDPDWGTSSPARQTRS